MLRRVSQTILVTSQRRADVVRYREPHGSRSVMPGECSCSPRVPPVTVGGFISDTLACDDRAQRVQALGLPPVTYSRGADRVHASAGAEPAATGDQPCGSPPLPRSEIDLDHIQGNCDQVTKEKSRDALFSFLLPPEM